MELSLVLPLDSGFLRRECPACLRQFKWHSGPTDSRPNDATDPDVYWCPYCGETAPPDHWWTADQLEFAQASAAGPLIREVADDFNRAMKGSNRDSIIQVSMSFDDGEPPPTLHEPADMVIVESPCHPWEPMKVAEDWAEPLRCLLCGAKFAVG